MNRIAVALMLIFLVAILFAGSLQAADEEMPPHRVYFGLGLNLSGMVPFDKEERNALEAREMLETGGLIDFGVFLTPQLSIGAEIGSGMIDKKIFSLTVSGSIFLRYDWKYLFVQPLLGVYGELPYPGDETIKYLHFGSKVGAQLWLVDLYVDARPMMDMDDPSRWNMRVGVGATIHFCKRKR